MRSNAEMMAAMLAFGAMSMTPHEQPRRGYFKGPEQRSIVRKQRAKKKAHRQNRKKNRR